ncbi:MerR family DNA-binding transcriptional regulator [Herbaspirillum sp. HC18]|nr:MerR family DNA-binding transcriptional regulator [Herbaspirillum sp. HC18]
MLLKVGELAKSAGLTVRALHYYDRIGLLKPSGRSQSGCFVSDSRPQLMCRASSRTIHCGHSGSGECPKRSHIKPGLRGR